MISDNIKRLRENMGLFQAALARKLGITRASVNAWEMELSSPTAVYLVEMAQLFHTLPMTSSAWKAKKKSACAA